MKPEIFRLSGKVQHYKWGGHQFIPQLLEMENINNEPFAELWMGTHTKGPSSISTNGKVISLPQLIQQHPSFLGQPTRTKFNDRLPFLFKILDVNQMLSIQAHPTKAQAEIGFQKENNLDIPLTAPNRTYRDDNHKPEVMVALSEFYLLHGFKSLEAISQTLTTIPAFNDLSPYFSEKDIFNLYQFIMEMPQEQVDTILFPLRESILPSYQNGALRKDQAEFWAGRAFAEDVLNNGHADRGIFSIFLFNLVHLQPGQAIFQDAGIPHAYLEGTNVELMANSDNVFRGGLTYKHIDVPELLKSLKFTPIDPVIIEPHEASKLESVYLTPAPDFGLSKIGLSRNDIHLEKSQSVQIGIVMSGSVEINGMVFEKGQSYFAPADIYYHIKGLQNDSVIFKAYVPAA